MIVLAIIVGAVVAAAEVWRADEERVERENEALARRAAAAVTRAIDVSAGSLQAAQALLDLDGRMERGRFLRFARGVTENGWLRGVSWVPRVPHQRRARFVEENLGGRRLTALTESGRLRLAPRRAVYYPIEIVWPDDPVRRRARGIDLRSDPVRWDAARSARDRGEPQATPPVQALAGGTAVVNLWQPLYEPGEPRRTRAQRREAIRGFVGGSVALEELSGVLPGSLPFGTGVRILDGSRVLLDTGLRSEYARAATSPVGGRNWQVLAAGPEEPSRAIAFGIGIGGLILAAIAAVAFVVADRREARLEARRRGAELRSQRDALHARTADVLESGVTVRERMGALASELVPAVCDFCVVDVLYGTDEWRRAGSAAVDERLARRLAEGSRVSGIPLGPDPGRAALLSGREAMEALRAGNRTEGLEELPLSSLVVLRLFARGRRVGLMLLGRLHRSSARDFTADDLRELRELGNRAALALDSARLYERERTTARTLQSRLLPARLPRPRGIAAAAVYRAGGEGMHVGGDFYDLYPVPSGWVAVVGDVCGSGAEAAALTSLLRHTLRTASRLSRPEHALSLVDSAAREETGGRTFLTLAAAWLSDAEPGEPVRARIAVGGHPEPRLVRADGSVTRIPPNGPLLGVIDEWSISTSALVIQPGETLLLFTDGLTEARHDGALYGDERLDSLLSRLADAPLEELLRELEADVLDFAGGGTHDDLAMLALRPRRRRQPE